MTPESRVGITSDILEEVDGPLLKHGLKALNGQRLRVVPRAERDKPDPEILQIHHARFLVG